MTLIPDTQEIPQTLQGFFDIAWNWAHRPGFELCKDRWGTCMYRSEDGQNACLIGACIPDSKHCHEMEERPASSAVRYLPPVAISADQLDQLQECHDDASSTDDVIKRLEQFAHNHNLTIPTT